jgi:hypothetical protein
MYREQIGGFEFVYEQETKRIMVYMKGDTSPVRHISVGGELSEKDFHYEIMDFVSKSSE